MGKTTAGSWRTDAAFTIVELIVVVLIFGILAALSVPGFLKSVETSKASTAAAIVAEVGHANQKYFINNQTYTSGQLTNAASGHNCDSTLCPVFCSNIYNLITCRYLSNQDWDGNPYDFWACNPTNGGGPLCPIHGSLACARRKSGQSPGTNNPTYETWAYCVDANGRLFLPPDSGAPKPLN